MRAPQEEARASLRFLVLVTRAEDEKRLEELLDNLRLPLLYQCRGKGTAPSEMLDIIQAVIFLFFAAEQFLAGYRQKIVVKSAKEELARQSAGAAQEKGANA